MFFRFGVKVRFELRVGGRRGFSVRVCFDLFWEMLLVRSIELW